MSRALDVYLQQDLVGQLIQEEHGQLAFRYAESWLNNPEAVPLSHSLLLKKEKFGRHECRGFFAGVLPDESKREVIARNLGISARNDFAMLEQIGGECAGAVTFLPAGQKRPVRFPLPRIDGRKAGGDFEKAASPSAAGGRRRHSPVAGRRPGQNRGPFLQRENFDPPGGSAQHPHP